VRLLLDTCTFLWLAGGTALSDEAADAIRLPANEVFLSAASVWGSSRSMSVGGCPFPSFQSG
jgi:PIN domain nuclease of toxin-antitoxin system